MFIAIFLMNVRCSLTKMNAFIFLKTVILLILGPYLVSGQATDTSYCYRFTWMGPSFTNESYASLNETSKCSDTYPNACRDPMVITNDGSPPDYEYLYNNHKERVLCRLSSGSVCAKWTTYFEETVEYTMHLCTKITVVDESPMTSGCIMSSVYNSSRRTELCACRSYPNSPPCNSALGLHRSMTALLCICVVLFTLIVLRVGPDCFCVP